MIVFFFTPADAHVEHATDAPVIAIKARETGYYPIYTRSTPDELNKDTPPDVLRSALDASLFGWHVPAAKPARDYVDARLADGAQL